MKIPKYRTVLLCSILLFAACNGGDTSNPDLGVTGSLGSGYIIYDWATEGLLEIDLQTGIKSTFIPDKNKPDFWDISLDRKKLLKVTDSPETFDESFLYTLTNIEDGTTISQFNHYPTEGGYSASYLSPDEKSIAVAPTFDDGITILDLQGNIFHKLDASNGEELRRETKIVWMPDGSLLFTTKNAIYRTNTDFTEATLIKEMKENDWGHISLSKDGSKIALRKGKHIWTMNSDGTNFRQVTESDQAEAFPIFSPDGKFLLVGTSYHTTGLFGYLWNLKIIPLDGQIHNLNEGEDPKVISVIAKGETLVETASGKMVWR